MDAWLGHRRVRGIRHHRGDEASWDLLRTFLLWIGRSAMIEDVDVRALAGDRAWRALEAKLRPFVAKRVPEADLDDVVQDVFLRIQRGLPALRDDQRFGPWVYQVARSAVGDHARRAARHPQALTQPEEPSHGSASHGPEPDEGEVAREVATYAALFVSMLPSPYREALTLTELEGLAQREAAEMLGVSLSGMKSRVQRGRAKLRAALEECCDIALDARHRVVGCEPRPDGKLPDECCPPSGAAGPGASTV
jgi:RNA polymerase sigma-70 factor (ECF subfamily)